MLAFAIFAVAGCAGTSLDDLLEAAGARPTPLDRSTIVAGLREALEVGTERTVERTAVIDGYLANEVIRIAIPDELDKMASTLRRIGLGRQVENLETSMNRAAEEAAGEARDVLWSEVRRLTIPDAVAILEGGSTAATDLLQERSADRIRERFEPIVVSKMEEVGLARLYADLAQRYNRLPFVSTPAIDLDRYVTDRALDGLFTVLGEEEAKIRSEPLARTTELLRRVFGSQR